MKIYVSSKVKHAVWWRTLREMGVPINSSWIDFDEEFTDEQWTQLWIKCVQEASVADALIFFAADNEEEFVGAYIEIGAALATNTPIYVVGGHRASWSFVAHPLVKFCTSINEAIELALSVKTSKERK